jgi:hypothetical protein
MCIYIYTHVYIEISMLYTYYHYYYYQLLLLIIILLLFLLLLWIIIIMNYYYILYIYILNIYYICIHACMLCKCLILWDTHQQLGQVLSPQRFTGFVRVTQQAQLQCQSPSLYRVPSGKQTKLLEIAIYSGFTHKKWWFCIVMLVYRRVHHWMPTTGNKLFAKICQLISSVCGS